MNFYDFVANSERSETMRDGSSRISLENEGERKRKKKE